LSRDQP